MVILPHWAQLFRCYIYTVYCIPLAGEPRAGLPQVTHSHGGRSAEGIAVLSKIQSSPFLTVISNVSCKLTGSKHRFSSKNSLASPLSRSWNLKLARIFGARPHSVRIHWRGKLTESWFCTVFVSPPV